MFQRGFGFRPELVWAAYHRNFLRTMYSICKRFWLEQAPATVATVGKRCLYVMFLAVCAYRSKLVTWRGGGASYLPTSRFVIEIERRLPRGIVCLTDIHELSESAFVIIKVMFNVWHEFPHPQ